MAVDSMVIGGLDLAPAPKAGTGNAPHSAIGALDPSAARAYDAAVEGRKGGVIPFVNDKTFTGQVDGPQILLTSKTADPQIDPPFSTGYPSQIARLFPVSDLTTLLRHFVLKIKSFLRPIPGTATRTPGSVFGHSS
jgi:hypothetical protein